MDRLIATQVFVTIVQRGSLSAAAETLDMSRSMVTRYLNAMEHWTQARLLHRSTRRLSLTPVGEQVYTQSQALLSLATAMTHAAEQPHTSLSGQLRVSSSQSLAQAVLIPIFRQFLDEHPRMRLDLQSSNQAVNLIEERIDLAIRITNALDPNLIARKLGDCESVLCASPAYLQRHSAPNTLEDLSTHNCLLYTHFGKNLWHFQHQGENHSIAVEGNFSANDSSLLLIAALEDMGVTLQPRFAAAPYLAQKTLMPLLCAYTPHTLGIYGLYSSRAHMPRALRVLLDRLVAEMATLDSVQASPQA